MHGISDRFDQDLQLLFEINLGTYKKKPIGFVNSVPLSVQK
jgi:hypothetical protein